MSSALLQELQEGLQALGEPRMRYYKILSLFSFDNGNEIHFGDNMAAYVMDSRPYEALRDYIREQKKWVRSTPDATLDEMRIRLWWLQMKLVEFGLFTPSEQRSIFPLMVL